MRVADLRAELHAAGVDHSGLKAALVQRVEALRMLSPRTAAAAPTRATRGTKRVRLELQPTTEDTGEGETVDLAGGQTAARAEGTSGRVAAPAAAGGVSFEQVLVQQQEFMQEHMAQQQQQQRRNIRDVQERGGRATAPASR